MTYHLPLKGRKLVGTVCKCADRVCACCFPQDDHDFSSLSRAFHPQSVWWSSHRCYTLWLQQRKMSYWTFIEDFPSFCIADVTALWKHAHGREICLDEWPHHHPCKQWGWVALYTVSILSCICTYVKVLYKFCNVSPTPLYVDSIPLYISPWCVLCVNNWLHAASQTKCYVKIAESQPELICLS